MRAFVSFDVVSSHNCSYVALYLGFRTWLHFSGVNQNPEMALPWLLYPRRASPGTRKPFGCLITESSTNLYSKLNKAIEAIGIKTTQILCGFEKSSCDKSACFSGINNRKRKSSEDSSRVGLGILIIWHKVQLQRQIMLCFKDFCRNPNFSPLAAFYRWKSMYLQGAIWGGSRWGRCPTHTP